MLLGLSVYLLGLSNDNLLSILVVSNLLGLLTINLLLGLLLVSTE